MARHRTFLVTGCSAGGVGAALAAALARDGDSHVFATARSPNKIPASLADRPNVTVLALDVTDDESVRRCAEAVREATEGLDVLVNNAGAGLTMPLLDTDIDEAKRLHDVNLWGALRMVQAFADLLIAAKGKIVNMSSVGAITNMAWNGAYAASKAGLNRVSDTLRIELAPFGVSVLTVMIGGAATKFITNEAARPVPEGSRYAPIGDEILHWARDKGGLENMMTPERLADGLIAKVVAPGKGGTVWIGTIATLMRFLSFWMPQWFMDRAMRMGGLDQLPKRIGKAEQCKW